MNRWPSSNLNSAMRRLIFKFMVYTIVSIALFDHGNTVYSIKDEIFSGTGYGNNGERFGSFMTCSGSNSFHYFEGSNIYFKTQMNDNAAGGNKSGPSIGSWIINFIADNSQSAVKIGGLITEANIDHNMYSLFGEETFDNVCNNVGNTITLTGECGENKKITFSDSNEKIGSIVPPDGVKLYELFGSVIDCD